MTFTDIVKGVPGGGSFGLKSPDGKEHYFFGTETGAIIYIRPKDGIVRLIHNYYTSNAAYVRAYSHTKNAAYFFIEIVVGSEYTIQMIQFELDTLRTKIFDCSQYLDNYVNYFQTPIAKGAPPHYVLPSTDGNIWFGGYRTRGVPNIIKFNTSTEEFEVIGFKADWEVELICGGGEIQTVFIDSGDASLHGYYTEALFEDDGTDLYSTIITELNASGLTYSDGLTFQILLHWDDRDIASTTRRVLIPANTWRFVDLKDTSVFNDSGQTVSGLNDWFDVINDAGWVNESAASVDNSNWLIGTIADNPTAFGLTLATYNMSINYSKTRFIGRFPYQYGARSTNSNFYDHAYNPLTGKAIYPNAFNKVTAFLETPQVKAVYWANMPMAQGFSGGNEYVFFHQDESGNWGYYRPDTNAFQIYNPITNSLGYTMVLTDIDDPDDPNGLGIYITEFESTEIELLGDTWVNEPGFTSAVNTAYAIEVDPVHNRASVFIEYLPDITREITRTERVDGIATVTGNISSAIESAAGEFVFGGAVYTGIVVGKDVAGDFMQTAYITDVLSLYSSCLWGTKVVFSGYLGKIQVIDVSDIDNPVLTEITWGINQYSFKLAARTNEVISIGSGVRRKAYENSYMKFGFITTVQNYFPDLPIILDVGHSSSLRVGAGLPESTYDTDYAHGVLKTYAAVNGYTWTQLKALFTGSTPYNTYDVVAYSNKVVISLRNIGISALQGLDIYVNEVGTGSVITSEDGRSTHYPKVLYFEKTNLVDLVEADYKLVEIQALGYADDFGLATIATDTYICFLFNEGTNLVVRAILKTAIEAGTPISSVDKTITIAKGTSIGNWGNLSAVSSNPYRAIGFGVADDLYVTIKDTAITSGGSPAIALKIDVAAQTWEVFLKSTEHVTPTTMTYNAVTDNVLATRGSTGELFENISPASLPLTY